MLHWLIGAGSKQFATCSTITIIPQRNPQWKPNVKILFYIIWYRDCFICSSALYCILRCQRVSLFSWQLSTNRYSAEVQEFEYSNAYHKWLLMSLYFLGVNQFSVLFISMRKGLVMLMTNQHLLYTWPTPVEDMEEITIAGTFSTVIAVGFWVPCWMAVLLLSKHRMLFAQPGSQWKSL